MLIVKIFFLIPVGIIVLFLLILFIEIQIAKQVKIAPFSNPSRDIQQFGTGPKLTYVVMGDSTAAGQGAKYTEGIAVKTAEHLSQKNSVELTNLGISGAQIHSVLEEQLPLALKLKPDVVLLSVGANDVTHELTFNNAKTDLEQIITKLISANCNVKIIVTGSPDMGGTLLFAQPLKFVAGLQAKRFNNTILPLISQYDLTHAPIARDAGPFFKKDPSLFASDTFHPNEKGYRVWLNVLIPALDTALASQLTHCK